MGRSSDWAIEVAEQNYIDQREEWIRRELGDPDADESTDGWHELELQYDQTYEHWEDYLQEEYEWHHSQNHSDFYVSFSRSIDDLKNILASHIEPAVIQTVYKMAYVHAVTAMETYLGDSLKSTVLGNKEYIANAAKNLNELTQRKFKLEDFVSENDFVAKIVLEQLCKYLYHDVARVMTIYKATIGFDYSYDLSELIKITTMRHDLVHRNGKDNDGNRVELGLGILNRSIEEIEAFVKYLDKTLKEHHEE
ncbi:MAG: hypothetical protein HWE07_01165 [Cytophagia bacterium]|nr:hypothetical protein [Cytophagia bacterium]